VTTETHSSAAGFSKAKAAAAMMVLPLLLIVAVKYWRADEQAAAAARIRSVVVAPARVLGGPELRYLGDAVTETLTAYLNGVPGLETRRPASSADFERMAGDYNELAKALSADALILPDITVDGELYMVHLQIADARSRTVLWSDRYQGTRARFIPLVQAAGEGVRRALRPDTTRPEFRGGVSSRAEAELSFREGEHLRDHGETEKAEAAFRRALEADSTLAIAAAEIGLLQAASSSGDLSEAESWAQRALEIDGQCGRAFTVLARVEARRQEPDFRMALSYALRGAALDPEYPGAHHVLAAALSGAPSLFKLAAEERRRLAPLRQELTGDLYTSPLSEEETIAIVKDTRDVPHYLQ
jgi:TolB-like protein